MQLKSSEYEKAVAKREFRAWLVYGPDQGRSNLLAHALLKRYQATGLDAVTRDATAILRSPAELADNLAGATLFSRASVLRIRDADDKIVKLLEPVLASDFSPSRLVIEAGELTAASKLKKLFEGADHLAAMACWAPSEDELQRRAGQALSALGIGFDPAVPARIASLSPPDSGALEMECRKLALYAGKEQLTVADVEAASGDHAEAALSDLSMAMASGQTVAALRAYYRLDAGGSAAIVALRALQRHFQRLHQARLAIESGSNADRAMSTLRPPVFWKEKDGFKHQLGRWKVATIEPVLARLVEIERQIKLGSEETATVGQFILDQTLKHQKAA